MITGNQGFTFLLNGVTYAYRPLFSLDPQTFISLIPIFINVVLLAVVMRWLLYNPVRNFMAKRAERVAGQLEEAEAIRAEAIALKNQYEQRLKDIEVERNAILDDARKQAVERRNRDMAETKKEVDAIKARATVEITAERDRVKDQVQQAIIEISSDMASKLLHTSIDPAAHNRLFDEAMDELEATVFKPATPTVAV
jgi:F-type H+-transporting ATPase subunit b